MLVAIELLKTEWMNQCQELGLIQKDCEFDLMLYEQTKAGYDSGQSLVYYVMDSEQFICQIYTGLNSEFKSNVSCLINKGPINAAYLPDIKRILSGINQQETNIEKYLLNDGYGNYWHPYHLDDNTNVQGDFDLSKYLKSFYF